MTIQQQAFQSYYRSLTDRELIKIAANRRSFVDVAQEALEHELHGRHLESSVPPATPRSAPPPPGSVARIVRRAGSWLAAPSSVALLLAVLLLVLFTTACASKPKGPQPGTPAFFWAAANETWRAGDYVKTSEHLQRILAGDNEFAARARAWDTVISAGLTQAYIELADTWEAGARMNRANPTPFRREVSTLRSLASAAAIQYAEDMHQLMADNKDPEIPLAFAFPAGAAMQPAALKRISGGIVIQDSERDLLRGEMLRRGVVLAVCAALGHADDTAAAQEMLKTAEVKVPRDTYLLAAARSMQAQSDLFTGKQAGSARPPENHVAGGHRGPQGPALQQGDQAARREDSGAPKEGPRHLGPRVRARSM